LRSPIPPDVLLQGRGEISSGESGLHNRQSGVRVKFRLNPGGGGEAGGTELRCWRLLTNLDGCLAATGRSESARLHLAGRKTLLRPDQAPASRRWRH